MRIVSESTSDRTKRRQPRLVSVAGSCCALAASTLLLGSQPNATAQSDNFDAGAPLNPAWTAYAASPLLYTFTFPTVGTGKGLGIHSDADPGDGLPAVVGLSQTNV